MSETVIIAISISVPIGGIIGYFIRTTFEDKLARSRNIDAIRIADFNKAAAEFYSYFVDEIFAFNDAIANGKPDDQGSYHIFKNRTSAIIDSRKKARILFERQLADSEREGFNAAWNKYAVWHEHYPDNKDMKEYTRIMFEHMKSLLEYAKPK